MASNGDSLLAGPLFNYKGMSNSNTDKPIWHGSVLVVLKPGTPAAELKLSCIGPAAAQGSDIQSSTGASLEQRFSAEKLYEDKRAAFWRYFIQLPFQRFEAKWEYHIAGLSVTNKSAGGNGAFTFAVPAANESMRIMFHSCNGFSVGTDMSVWTGPVLWNEVLRQHQQRPIHVMLGGGDQIYNDEVMVSGPLRAWTDIGNPVHRKKFPFGERLRAECDDWYLKNYLKWYSTEPFSNANCIIPQVNIWDDHDIIDGFGSYTDNFMQCHVFKGIGAVAQKYYLLFQHHIPPPASTFTTDAPKDGSPDPEQTKDTWVKDSATENDPSFIIGGSDGPYVEQRSRSLYLQLGARIAFLGIDARTERTRRQINYPDTYKRALSYTSKQIALSNGNIKHLILLLGVPIAYPRLQWLENILSSPVIGPIKFLNKRFGVGGGLFNSYDGGVDLLDDLDDHYTSHHHKKERRELIQNLQKLSKEHSVRITILGGDVHLAALGRFYSNPSLGIPIESDWRYMANVVSSAITNKPPPAAVANLLAKRNKIHHLDPDTDETLLNLFDCDPVSKATPDLKKKKADSNHCTMPSRNFALISESNAPSIAARAAPANGTAEGQAHEGSSGNPRDPIHDGETNCGASHPAASGIQRTGLCGAYGLDITYRVEIDSKDVEGHAEGYGLSIPALDAGAYKEQGEKW